MSLFRSLAAITLIVSISKPINGATNETLAEPPNAQASSASEPENSPDPGSNLQESSEARRLSLIRELNSIRAKRAEVRAENLAAEERLSKLHKYITALNSEARVNWDTTRVPNPFVCEVMIYQNETGIVNDVQIGLCPYSDDAKQSVVDSLLGHQMPYEEFKDVFTERVKFTFCYPEEKCSQPFIPPDKLFSIRFPQKPLKKDGLFESVSGPPFKQTTYTYKDNLNLLMVSVLYNTRGTDNSRDVQRQFLEGATLLITRDTPNLILNPADGNSEIDTSDFIGRYFKGQVNGSGYLCKVIVTPRNVFMIQAISNPGNETAEKRAKLLLDSFATL